MSNYELINEDIIKHVKTDIDVSILTLDRIIEITDGMLFNENISVVCQTSFKSIRMLANDARGDLRIAKNIM